MTNPAEYYDRFFHQAGFSDNDATGSVYDFYRDGSNGKYDPQFKVYGPVTMSHGYSYYSGPGGYTNTWKMIKEAVNIVDSLYDVDFTKFDTDGDGEIDNVYCIYAGYGQADTDLSSVIWPHSAYLKDASVYDRSTHGYVQSDERFAVDGVNVDRYTVSQEINGQTKKTCGIGTLCHEFGHVLGFADHYNPQTNDGFLPPTNQLLSTIIGLIKTNFQKPQPILTLKIRIIFIPHFNFLLNWTPPATLFQKTKPLHF